MNEFKMLNFHQKRGNSIFCGVSAWSQEPRRMYNVFSSMIAGRWTYANMKRILYTPLEN